MEVPTLVHQGDEITSAQRLALGSGQGYNLTDGHPRRPPLPNEQDAINRLPEFFEQATNLSVPEVEQGLLAEYARFSVQTIHHEASFVFPSASNAMICAAMLLRHSRPEGQRNSLKAGVITPIFDNIPGILQGSGISVEPIPEQNFTDGAALEAKVADKDALLLVSPNNPTGFTLSAEQLTMVAQVCKAAGVALIVDSCFRLYKQEAQFDTAKLLDETGASYVLINDTGKLWALHENKAGIVSVSEDLRKPAKTAHDIMQLSTSSTTMLMLTELMRSGGDMEAIMAVLGNNRAVLKDELSSNENCALIYPGNETGLPVELLEFSPDVHCIDGKRISRLGAALLAAACGVHLMPLTEFMLDFTPDNSADPAMARISLSRGKEHFAQAAQVLGNVTADQLMKVQYGRYF
jgi:aspartate/methionine/tyrosine aminotransferase